MTESKTPLELAALASAAIPNLRVTELCPPQSADADSSRTGLVDVQGNRWVVVADKHEITREDFEKYLDILDYLGVCSASQLLSFEVPQVGGAVATGPATYASVYKYSGGSPVTEDQLLSDGLLAASLGRTLGSLHALNPNGLLDFGLTLTGPEQAKEQVRELIGSVGNLIPVRLRTRWLAAVDEASLWSFEPAPVHGDLSSGSILADGGAVLAITNFHALSIGDPAQDLAWILPLVDDEFIESFRLAYFRETSVPDLHLLTRAQLHSELALAVWLAFGLENQDQEIVLEAQEMLAELDQDLAGSLLVRSSRPVADIHFTSEQEPLNRVPSLGSNHSVESVETEPHEEFSQAPDLGQYSVPTSPPALIEELVTEDLSAIVDNILAGYKLPE